MAAAVDASDIVFTAQSLHKTSPVATAALGRMLAAGSLMGANLKQSKAKINLSIKGDGPLGTVFVVGDSNGNVRGYVGNNDCPTEYYDNGKLNVAKAVGKEGTLGVIRDYGSGEPYIGQVPIVSGEIAEDSGVLTKVFRHRFGSEAVGRVHRRGQRQSTHRLARCVHKAKRRRCFLDERDVGAVHTLFHLRTNERIGIEQRRAMAASLQCFAHGAGCRVMPTTGAAGEDQCIHNSFTLAFVRSSRLRTRRAYTIIVISTKPYMMPRSQPT